MCAKNVCNDYVSKYFCIRHRKVNDHGKCQHIYHLIKETLELRWVPVQLLGSNDLKSLILKIGPCYDLPEHNDLP